MTPKPPKDYDYPGGEMPEFFPPAELNCRCQIIVLIPWRDIIRQSLHEQFGSTDVPLFFPIR